MIYKIEKTNYNEEIGQIEIQLTATLERINELEGQILEYNNSLDSIRGELSTIEKEISEKESKLTVLENDYVIQSENFEKRLIAIYKAGETSYLDVTRFKQYFGFHFKLLFNRRNCINGY